MDGASRQTEENVLREVPVFRTEEVDLQEGKHHVERKATWARDTPVWHLDVRGGLVLSKETLTEGLADRMKKDCVGQLFDLLDFNHDGFKPQQTQDPNPKSDPNPQTSDPRPQTPKHKPQPPNPKPQTPDPRPQTPDPKPQTPNPASNPRPHTPYPRP